jgi:hypothetical protein
MKISSILKLSLLLVFSFAINTYAQKRVQRQKPTPTSSKLAAPIQQKFSVYFDVNQAKIKSNDYKVLDSVVLLLNDKNNNIRRVQINGYADTTGGAEANLELSNKRTDTVANYIIGRNLAQYKNKITTAFFGEKVSGKESDLTEMRRVDIVLFLSKPDRDTTFNLGCIKAIVKANTFEGFNNEELDFKFEYIGNAEDVKKHNLGNKDTSNQVLLSNGMARLTATFKGKPVKAMQDVIFQLPKINYQSGYKLYKNQASKSGESTWIPIDGKVIDEKTIGLEGENCDVFSVYTSELNNFINCGTKNLACNCSADPFGGLLNPVKSNDFVHFGSQKTVVQINNSCFKKVDAAKTYFKVKDDLNAGDFPDFCTSLMYPGIGNVPEINKYEREVLGYLDFDVSNHNDSADLLMVKKTRVLVYLPKSKYPEHEGKQYAILHAETKKDDFLDWTGKITLSNNCLGIANCDYWVFEVPFTGFYSILEVTPVEKRSKRDKDSEDESTGDESVKYITVKSKKFNNVSLYYGDKSENKIETARFVKNKGKNSINEPEIEKKNKKDYKNHVFLVYVIKNGKRYAWIGTGSQLKTNIFTGNWKTPKLKYIPDEEWENFIKRFCE